MHTYLALGDSYTIGELVPIHDNFPFQTVGLLRKNNVNVADPVIIATTGWTTDELAASIMEHNIRETFSFVTLLIGVNNQYRGRSLENYKEEYLELLNQAIAYAGGNPNRVFVLSIPDWGATPYADGKDRNTIALEIDSFNAACQSITLDHKCHYLDITPGTREHGMDKSYLATDELHPSGKEYSAWAAGLAVMVQQELNSVA